MVPAPIELLLVDVDVTDAPGIVTLVRPVQPKNASSPILVTLLGIVTAVKPVQ